MAVDGVSDPAPPVAPGDPPARLAASCVLARDSAAGIEVFMLRRPPTSSFAAGALVFPGGAVDAADSAPPVLERCTLPPPDVLGRLLLDDPAAAAASYVAAARELLEEAGVLCGDADTPGAAAEARAALLAGAPLDGVLEHHGVRLALDRMTYVAHFVTPLGEPRRYDTRFFLLDAGDGPAEPTGHAAESVAGGWFHAGDVLGEHGHDLATLMPPTRILLRELAEHGTVAAARDDLGSRPVTRLLFALADVRGGRVPDRLPRP